MKTIDVPWTRQGEDLPGGIVGGDQPGVGAAAAVHGDTNAPRARRRVQGGVLAGLLAATLAGGCAAGSSGAGDGGDATRPIPEQRRNVVRVSGYHPVELMNEGNLDVATIPMEAATVWVAVGGVYSDLEIPVTESDPRAMHLGNLGYSARRVDGRRMNTFVDCGSDLAGPLANQYDITLTVYSRLTAKGPASTELATVVDAYGRPRAVSGNPLHCNSRGSLESLIADKVAEALGIGGR